MTKRMEKLIAPFMETKDLYVFHTGKIEYAVEKEAIEGITKEFACEENPWKDADIETVINDCTATSYGQDNVNASILIELLCEIGYSFPALVFHENFRIMQVEIPELERIPE